MNVGTKSILFGVHQFVLHPLFVLRAWLILYEKWPCPYELLAIMTHDLGYWGAKNMDGEEGERHPEVAARWWDPSLLNDASFKSKVAHEILGHSRFYAAKQGTGLSKLFRADKLASALYPKWLYLLLSNLSGEIHEYIAHSKHGNHSVKVEHFTQKRWIIEVQAHMALMGLEGGQHKEVAKLMKEKGTCCCNNGCGGNNKIEVKCGQCKSI